ncbi:hypothetical protein ES702_03140 [subsurface metagenome]
MEVGGEVRLLVVGWLVVGGMRSLGATEGIGGILVRDHSGSLVVEGGSRNGRVGGGWVGLFVGVSSSAVTIADVSIVLHEFVSSCASPVFSLCTSAAASFRVSSDPISAIVDALCESPKPLLNFVASTLCSSDLMMLLIIPICRFPRGSLLEPVRCKLASRFFHQLLALLYLPLTCLEIPRPLSFLSFCCACWTRAGGGDVLCPGRQQSGCLGPGLGGRPRFNGA